MRFASEGAYSYSTSQENMQQRERARHTCAQLHFPLIKIILMPSIKSGYLAFQLGKRWRISNDQQLANKVWVLSLWLWDGRARCSLISRSSFCSSHRLASSPTSRLPSSFVRLYSTHPPCINKFICWQANEWLIQQENNRKQRMVVFSCTGWRFW